MSHKHTHSNIKKIVDAVRSVHMVLTRKSHFLIVPLELCYQDIALKYQRIAFNFTSSGEWNDLQSFKLACRGSDPENILNKLAHCEKDALKEVSKRDELGIEEFLLLKRSDFRFEFWVNHLSRQSEVQLKTRNELNKEPSDLSKLRGAVRNDKVGVARYFLADRLMR
ncbi:hypothetical protein JTE90_012467 [Oedothorax gibbosus]|uniref:Uncharacterized protein n=1 Tax=Oedothorax gibbosus TaxID=931172 RepID=A0AAV6UF50_9ARAC|nr:hypothetical protein JTE90_012467 [Oedothorax gibbosus]